MKKNIYMFLLVCLLAIGQACGMEMAGTHVPGDVVYVIFEFLPVPDLVHRMGIASEETGELVKKYFKQRPREIEIYRLKNSFLKNMETFRKDTNLLKDFLETKSMVKLKCIYGGIVDCIYGDVSTVKVKDPHLNLIAEMLGKNLQTLYIVDGSQITDLGLKCLSNTKLKSLDLPCCKKTTDAGVEYISKITGLENLSLPCWNQITDVGFKFLVNLKNIKCLDISGFYLITDDSIKLLAGFKNLQKLNIRACCKITDIGIEHLSKNKTLQSLDLSDSNKITDAALKFLINLKNLRYLKLYLCGKITNLGLEHLSKITSLQSLNLSCCYKITIVGLKFLVNLKNLKYLNFYFDKYHRNPTIKMAIESTKELKQKLPELEIEISRPELNESGLDKMISSYYLRGKK